MKLSHQRCDQGMSLRITSNGTGSTCGSALSAVLRTSSSQALLQASMHSSTPSSPLFLQPEGRGALPTVTNPWANSVTSCFTLSLFLDPISCSMSPLVEIPRVTSVVLADSPTFRSQPESQFLAAQRSFILTVRFCDLPTDTNRCNRDLNQGRLIPTSAVSPSWGILQTEKKFVEWMNEDTDNRKHCVL